MRQALEPEWEAKVSAHFSGFRPGRSWWDAIAAVCHRLKFRPQYLLKVDISTCFDRIDHAALLATLQAPARIRRHVRAWLRSGIMEADTCSPTTAGTPQGGSIAPLLALMAVHGIEDAITQVSPEARVIASADDCLVLHPDRAVLEHCQQLFSEWLAGIGRTLNTSKTRLSPTVEGDQVGTEFLGFHLQQFRVGKHQSGQKPGGARLGFTTLIQPAKPNVKDHLAERARTIRNGQHWPQEAVIRQLNPQIRGWANYYRTWVCQATCGRLDYLTWVTLRRWASRRHPHPSRRWMHTRYWRRRETDAREVFATPKTPAGQGWLTHHSEIPSAFHAKVAGNRSPYDGDWVYWSRRRGHDPTVPTRVATRLKRQSGRCAYGGQYFHQDDQLEVDHINGDRRNSR